MFTMLRRFLGVTALVAAATAIAQTPHKLPEIKYREVHAAQRPHRDYPRRSPPAAGCRRPLVPRWARSTSAPAAPALPTSSST